MDDENDCVSILLSNVNEICQKTKSLLNYDQEFFDLWTIEEKIMINQQKKENLFILDRSFNELHELVMQREEIMKSILNHH